jgi:hypothetical protein|uniref:Uncharacterized protein n=1 Tax=viral metagenome TaxID=1070528 RepID=A0A6C0CLB8_9ZZZZ
MTKIKKKVDVFFCNYEYLIKYLTVSKENGIQKLFKT